MSILSSLPGFIGSSADAFNSLLQNSGGTTGIGLDEQLQAMRFSSTLRDSRVGGTTATRAAQHNELVDQPDGTSTFIPTFTGSTTTTVEPGPGLKPIIMSVNPNSVSFEQPKRMTRQDTMRGTVWHHFTNNKAQNNDLLTISFSGSTGNLAPSGREPADRDMAVARLSMWHNLYQLTREQILLPNGRQNVFSVDYYSQLFPTGITFYGFFSEVLSFKEDGSKPNSRDYSMKFIVQRTVPDMDQVINAVLGGGIS